MRKLRYGGPNEKVTWAAKVLDVGVVLFVTAIFWIPALLYAMDDYAIQKHPVMATNKALVTEVHNYHRTSDLEVEYITNTGEHITTELTNGWFSCCDTDPDDFAHQGLNAHPGNSAYVGDAKRRAADQRQADATARHNAKYHGKSK